MNNILVEKEHTQLSFEFMFEVFSPWKTTCNIYNMIPTLDPVVKPPHDQVQKSIGYPPVARVFFGAISKSGFALLKGVKINKKKREKLEGNEYIPRL